MANSAALRRKKHLNSETRSGSCVFTLVAVVDICGEVPGIEAIKIYRTEPEYLKLMHTRSNKDRNRALGTRTRFVAVEL